MEQIIDTAANDVLCTSGGRMHSSAALLDRLGTIRRPLEEEGFNYQGWISGDLAPSWAQIGTVRWKEHESRGAWVVLQEQGTSEVELRRTQLSRTIKFSVDPKQCLSVYTAGTYQHSKTVGTNLRKGFALEITSKMVQGVLDKEDAPAEILLPRGAFSDSRLQRLLYALRAVQSDKAVNAALIESLQLSITHHLLAMEGRAVHPDAGSKFSPASRRIIESYIRCTLSECPNITSISLAVGLAPARFYWLFRETFGVSPHQYIMRLRVDEATRLISANDRPLYEIAQELGFSSAAHFSSTYKRLTGSTPSVDRDRAIAGYRA